MSYHSASPEVIINISNPQNDLLESWQEYCKTQSKLHNKSRSYFRHWNYFVAIPAILLSTVAGTANVSTSRENNTINIYSLVFGLMSVSSAVLFSIHRYLRLSELQQEHDFYGDMYEMLALEIEMQKVLETDEKSRCYKNLSEFMKNCKRQLDILIDKSPAPLFDKVCIKR